MNGVARGYVWKRVVAVPGGNIWRRRFPHECMRPEASAYNVGDIFVCHDCQKMFEVHGGSAGNRWVDARSKFVNEFIEDGLTSGTEGK